MPRPENVSEFLTRDTGSVRRTQGSPHRAARATCPQAEGLPADSLARLMGFVPGGRPEVFGSDTRGAALGIDGSVCPAGAVHGQVAPRPSRCPGCAECSRQRGARFLDSRTPFHSPSRSCRLPAKRHRDPPNARAVTKLFGLSGLRSRSPFASPISVDPVPEIMAWNLSIGAG